ICASTWPSRSATSCRMPRMRVLAHSRAARNRSISASTSASGLAAPGTRGTSQCSTAGGPMTMPGEAGIPSRPCLKTSLLSEPALHELDELLDGGQRVLAAGPDGDLAAVLGGQHHHAHDALAVDLEVILADPHIGAEARGELDEFRGGPGVQAVLVPNGNRAFVIDGG